MTRPPTDEPDTDGTSDAGRGATKEVYGFVAWIATFFLFGAYLLWAYLPESWLHAIGVTYYPDKYVSISIEVQAWFGLHNGGGDGGGGDGGAPGLIVTRLRGDFCSFRITWRNCKARLKKCKLVLICTTKPIPR
jgi:hypothetical protein